MIIAAAAGRMPAFVDTGLNFVHVDDVAAGHIAALERGRVGERYILGGDNVALRDMLSEIAVLTGRRAPRLKLRRARLFPFAVGEQMFTCATGREPLFDV